MPSGGAIPPRGTSLREGEIEAIVIINNPLIFRRPIFINTFNRKRFDVLRITADVERMCAPNPALLPAARDRRLSANFNIYGLLAVHDSEDRYRDVRRQCWQLIKDYRLGSLRNPRVRLKNKLGVLVSLCGETTFALFSKIVYR